MKHLMFLFVLTTCLACAQTEGFPTAPSLAGTGYPPSGATCSVLPPEISLLQIWPANNYPCDPHDNNPWDVYGLSDCLWFDYGGGFTVPAVGVPVHIYVNSWSESGGHYHDGAPGFPPGAPHPQPIIVGNDQLTNNYGCVSMQAVFSGIAGWYTFQSATLTPVPLPGGGTSTLMFGTAGLNKYVGLFGMLSYPDDQQINRPQSYYYDFNHTWGIRWFQPLVMAELENASYLYALSDSEEITGVADKIDLRRGSLQTGGILEFNNAVGAANWVVPTFEYHMLGSAADVSNPYIVGGSGIVPGSSTAQDLYLTIKADMRNFDCFLGTKVPGSPLPGTQIRDVTSFWIQSDYNHYACLSDAQ